MKLHQIAFAVATMAAGIAHAAPVTPDLVVRLAVEGLPGAGGGPYQAAIDLCAYGDGQTTTKKLSNVEAGVGAIYCSAGVKSASGLDPYTKVLVTWNTKEQIRFAPDILLRKYRVTSLDVQNLDDTCGTHLPYLSCLR